MKQENYESSVWLVSRVVCQRQENWVKVRESHIPFQHLFKRQNFFKDGKYKKNSNG